MKRSGKIKSKMKILSITLLSLLMVTSFMSVSHAEWKYGIGTGMFGLNIDGDVGVTTTLFGPVEMDLDLDASEISDLIETAYGFGGYATDGTWMIRSSFAYMDLKGDEDMSESGSNIDYELEFEVTGFEFIVGYPVYTDPSARITLDGGLRYTKHELNSSLDITGAVTESIDKNLDNDWVDLVLGATLSVPATKTLKWNTSANAGFGGSDGTYLLNTGLAWRFYKGWSGTLYYKYTSVDYENDNKGDKDWYKYDSDEYGPGITILYNF